MRFKMFFMQFRVLSPFAESTFYPHLQNPRFNPICGIRVLSLFAGSAFYPYLWNPRFIPICGIHVLSPFAESTFYPHLQNPRFIPNCGIRVLSPFEQSANGPLPLFVLINSSQLRHIYRVSIFIKVNTHENNMYDPR